MLKTYLFLVGAIICEVCGTMLLPVTQNFTKVTPTVFLAVFYLSAFYLLTFVVDKLPIAIVYGTWSGLGIFTIAILGYIFFKQSLSWQAILGMFLIVVGVTLVNIYSSIYQSINECSSGSCIVVCSVDLRKCQLRNPMIRAPQ